MGVKYMKHLLILTIAVFFIGCNGDSESLENKLKPPENVNPNLLAECGDIHEDIIYLLDEINYLSLRDYDYSFNDFTPRAQNIIEFDLDHIDRSGEGFGNVDDYLLEDMNDFGVCYKIKLWFDRDSKDLLYLHVMYYNEEEHLYWPF